MDRAREIVEVKTEGIVVWSNKNFLAVYRGGKKLPRFKNVWKRDHNSIANQENSSSSISYQTITRVRSDGSSFEGFIHRKDRKWESLQLSSLYERESARLLDGLGPRFVDWWMHKPLPVDGDLLPEIVPGFKTPFRVCPPFTRSKLIDVELTYLRKLARPLPTHFVLANCLEAESGGILVTIVKLKEGYAIIVYRGKNYKRPKLVSENLLSKREALSRSLEIQRIGSLRFFANQREQAIYDLKSKLAEFSARRNGFTSS